MERKTFNLDGGTEMIGFRLDANEQIATGHMMRCMAIAKQCELQGEKCIFLLSEDKNTDILQENHFMYHVLNVNWQDWDDSIPKVIEAVYKFQIRCMVVDSYQVTCKFFSELNTKTKLFYIDDMCSEAFAVHMALHYSQFGEETMIEDLYRGTKTVTYSGLKYVPLREEFFEKTKGYTKKQILITTGGTDPLHFTLRLCEKLLMDESLNKYEICAILGKMNSDKKELDILAKENLRLKVYQNIRNMDDMMRESALAVSAGGTTVYELFACGIPVVCFGLSNDQIGMGERLKKTGLVIWAGDARIDVNRTIENAINGLKQYASCNTSALSSRLQEQVDGKGCERIAQILRRALYDHI